MEQTSGDTTTGNLGQAGRLRITPSGEVLNADGTPRLGWFVAADDRWHVPTQETAVRQRRIGGTPVTETRLRVPNGDVVQRIYSTADAGGVTVIEVENESTLPVAIAFDRRDVLTERPIGSTPVEGIELGADAFVLPLGHRASLRIGVRHTGGGGPLGRIVGPDDVVGGWLDTAARAGSFELPNSAVGLVERAVALRCDLLLDGVPAVADDPVGFLVGLDQVIRMGFGSTADRLEAWMPDVVDAVALVAPATGWQADAALAAADRVLLTADEDRARRDLARILDRRPFESLPATPPVADDGDLAFLAWLERRFAAGGTLLPAGLPSDWRGQSFACHRLPSVTGSTISFAVRWHGERPAVLWEQHGPPVTLNAPSVDETWSTTEAAGEALWKAGATPEVTQAT